MIPRLDATSLYSCRSQRSNFASGCLLSFPWVRRAVVAVVMSVAGRWTSDHRRRASIAEPDRTVAAFHSPFAKTRSTAPMSLRRLRRSASEVKLSSAVAAEIYSSATALVNRLQDGANRLSYPVPYPVIFES